MRTVITEHFKALPAALDIVKLRGSLTGTGVTDQGRAGGEGEQPEGHGGQAYRSQVQTQLWLKVVVVMPCLLLIKSPAAPPAPSVLKYSIRGEYILF